MFAVSSWREPATLTPRLNTSSKTTPKLSATLGVLREPAVGPPPYMLPPAVSSAARVPSPAPAPAPAKRRGRRVWERRAAERAAASVAESNRVDFFLHLHIPTTHGPPPQPLIDPEKLVLDCKAQAAPLRVCMVGPPRVLLFHRPTTSSLPGELTGEDGAGCAGEFDAPLDTPHISAGGSSDTTTTPRDATPDPPIQPPQGAPETYQVSLLFAEEAEATALQSYLNQRFPSLTTNLVPRRRQELNASLVLKALTSMRKSERILAELNLSVPGGPSYVRFHRSDRGVFKNVIFIKYPNRTMAENSKLILERFYMGARPLKVEFKKKFKPSSGDGSCLPTPQIAQATPMLSAAINASAELEKLVHDLRVSTEYEGFKLSRSQLSKEDLRSLKQLCQFYTLQLDLQSSETHVSVRRQLGAPTSYHPSLPASASIGGVSAVSSTKVSPQLRAMKSPQLSYSKSETYAPVTGKSWKSAHADASVGDGSEPGWLSADSKRLLDILRCPGEEPGVTPFSAGRGRPT